MNKTKKNIHKNIYDSSLPLYFFPVFVLNGRTEIRNMKINNTNRIGSQLILQKAEPTDMIICCDVDAAMNKMVNDIIKDRNERNVAPL